MHRCSVCGVEKPLDDFHRHARRFKNGFSSTCKSCAIARAQAWYADNRERAKEQRKAFYAANKERRSTQMKEYRLANIERDIENKRKWRLANRERKKETDAAWVKANLESVRISKCRMEAVRRGRKRGADGTHTPEDIRRIRKAQKDRCACCNIKLNGGGQVDHIKPLATGGSNWPRNLQLLCKPCNATKNARDPIEFMQSLGRLL